MSEDNRKRSYRNDLLLASVMVAAGISLSGLSLAELRRSRSADGAGDAAVAIVAGRGNQAVSARRAGGDRYAPSRGAPQPAHPDAGAQKTGAAPALPPAPPEKIAPPIKEMVNGRNAPMVSRRAQGRLLTMRLTVP